MTIENIKGFMDYGLALLIAILFVYMVFRSIKSLINYIPDIIHQHFDELAKMRETHKQETEAFQTTLQTITDKFVSQLKDMNDENKVFYKAIEQEHAKHYYKLEEMHGDIKIIKNLTNK